MVKTVLMAQAIYHLTSIKLPKAMFQALDKIKRKLLWAGSVNLSGAPGGGGGGGRDLQRFAQALSSALALV